MKRITAFVAIALMLCAPLLLAQDYPVTVTDDRGVEVTIDAPPSRIIVTGTPLYSQIIIDLGAVNRVVAVADSPNNPHEVASLESIGPSFSPNVEVIISLLPDLVLGAGDWGGEREKLEAAGITVLTTPLITDIPGLLETIGTIGTTIGLQQEARDLVCAILEDIISIESSALLTQRVKTAFLYPQATDAPPYAAGCGAIENELIYRAGGENVFSDVRGFPQIGFEAILERDPEVIFTDPSQIESISGNQLLQQVSAIRNDRVHGIAASHVTSTKVADALRQMATLLRPELE